jgi:hypothetical protein
MGDLSQFASDNNVTFEIVKVEGRKSTVKFTARNKDSFEQFKELVEESIVTKK